MRDTYTVATPNTLSPMRINAEWFHTIQFSSIHFAPWPDQKPNSHQCASHCCPTKFAISRISCVNKCRETSGHMIICVEYASHVTAKTETKRIEVYYRAHTAKRTESNWIEAFPNHIRRWFGSNTHWCVLEGEFSVARTVLKLIQCVLKRFRAWCSNGINPHRQSSLIHLFISFMRQNE